MFAIHSALRQRNFWLLCFASFCFFNSYHLYSPTLPLYFASFNWAGWLVGFLLAVFMVASLVCRPFAGKWGDEFSKRPLMMLGALCFFVGSLGFVFCPPQVWVLTILRLLQGIGFALFYTASSSYLTQTVPQSVRAEGISHHSNAVKLAIAVSPVLALLLLEQFGFSSTFWVASLLSFLAFILAFFLKPLPPSQPGVQGKLLNAKAVFPGVLIACNSIVFGAIIPFIPLLAQEKTLESPALFYVVYALALISTRFFSGRFSDQWGRERVIIPGMVMVSVSVILMALAPSAWLLLGAALLYGLGAGVVQPSLIALVADRTEAYERTSAMATFTMFTDLGVGSGYFLAATMGAAINFSAPLYVVAGLCLLGAAIYALRLRYPSQTNRGKLFKTGMALLGVIKQACTQQPWPTHRHS